MDIFLKKTGFSFKRFTGISVSGTALLKFNFLISLKPVFLSTGENKNLKNIETLFQ